MEKVVFNGLQVSQLMKENEGVLDGLLVGLIHDIAFFLEPNKGLSKDHIMDVCTLIKHQLWMLKIEEIAFVFQQIKKGGKVTAYDPEKEREYSLPLMGEVYGRLSPAQLIRALHRWHSSTNKMNYIHETQKHQEPNAGELAEILKNRLQEKGGSK